jgi:DNA polymerase III epsilon subunit-like protein
MKVKRLIFDIETSFCKGHFWRPGYGQRIGPEQITEFGKIISFHWKWLGDEKVKHIHWGLNKQCDKKIVEKAVKLFDEADEIIAHFGDKFDIPWVRTRAAFHNIPMRPDYNTIDTKKWASKYLALPSNSLKSICQYFGLSAKLDPGGIETWQDVIFRKDAKALKHLLYYGDGDIVSLEAAFKKLRPYVEPNMHAHSDMVHIGGMKYAPGKFFCPECGDLGRHRKQYRTRAGTIRHYMSCRKPDCLTSYKVSSKTFRDYLSYKAFNNIK